MFDEVLISGSKARRRQIGESQELWFKIRLPWYRSIYLSCLDEIRLKIDGVEQDVDKIAFRLYGTTYRFAELVKHHSVLWFVLDEAELGVVVDDGQASADQIELSLAVHIRIPYHAGNVFRQVATCTRSLPVKQRIAA